MKNSQAHIITNIPDANGDYTYIKNNRKIVVLNKQEYDVAKLVYSSFNTKYKNLDPKDTSWDVDFIDGNYLNTNYNNLQYIEK